MNTPNYPPAGPYGAPPPGPPGPGTPPGGQQPYGPPPGGPYGPPGTPPGGFGAPGQGAPGQGGFGPPPGTPPGTPPGGQPFGAAQGFGAPDGQPAPGGLPPAPPQQAPAAKPGRSKVIKIVALVVVALVVAGGVIWAQSTSASSAEVGECIKVNDAASADIEKIDCNAEEAVYKVAVTKDDSGAECPGEFYMEYTETGRNELLLCLSLNAKEGDCFNATAQSHLRVACTEPEAMFQISKVVEGKNDAAECGDAAVDALTYPEPPLTMCRVAPDATAS